MYPRFLDVPSLVVWHDHPQDLAGGIRTRGVVQTLPHWRLELDRMISVLRAYEDWRDGDVTPDLSNIGATELERLSARETARIAGYIVYGCSTARVAQAACRQADRILDALDPAGSANRAARAEEANSRTRTIRKLRNKVFGHPAAVMKDEDDSFSLRATSVPYAAGAIASVSGRTLALGGVQIAAIGEKVPARDVLPSISFDHARREVIDALRAWHDALSATMEALRAHPDDSLRVVFPTALRLDRA